MGCRRPTGRGPGQSARGVPATISTGAALLTASNGTMYRFDMRSVTAVFLLVLLRFGSSAQAQEGAPAGPVPPQLLQHRRELLLGRIADGLVILRSARV